MEKIIKLIDENLVGQKGLSRYSDPKINWRRDIDEYDIAIYTDRMCFTQPINSNKINCAWIIEPPIINGENYINVVKNKDNFKYIFSHIKNVENQTDNFIYIPHGGTWVKDEDVIIHEKSKLVSCIFSWKDWNPYHRMRFRVYDRFKDSNIIDFYGSGCGKELDYKIDAIKDHMFTVVIENSIESDYFTEKILDCFLTGTIPIYCGCSNIGDFFNINGIITFETETELLDIVVNLSDSTYQQKLKYIQENFELAQKFSYNNDNLFNNFLQDLI
jgi:hypothetical protein